MGQRILFVSNSGWGRVNPLLTIAGELAARGVGDIWFASTDGHRDAIEAIPGGEPPVRFASLGPVVTEKEPESWSDATLRAMTTRSTLRNIKAVWTVSADFDYRRRQYLRTCEIIDEVGPALAVVDMFSHSAMDAIGTKHVPYLTVCPATPSQVYTERLPKDYPTPLSGLPRNMTPRQRVYNRAFRFGYAAMGWDPRTLRENVQFFRDRQAEGLVNPSSAVSKYADGAIAVLSYFVFGYEYPFPAPDNLKMVGGLIPAALGPADDGGDLGRWLDLHESIVYTAFGTIMRLNPRQISAIVDAVAEIGPDHHMLWKLPRSRQHLLPAALPPNLRVESWVPSQLATLAHPHVRASFNHGGDNSVQESLYFGKPQLVMPFWMDNADNASRVIDSGAGLAVARHREPDGHDIAAKLTRLLREPGFASRGQHWAERMREAGGVSAAADEVAGALAKVGRVSS
jgi:polyene glycosyltransferase